VLGAGWPRLELKQRMRRITETLHQFLPGDYRQQLGVLSRIAPEFGGFEAMFFRGFCRRYGLDDFSASVAALELFTQYSSSEYAVRPFIRPPRRTHDGADDAVGRAPERTRAPAGRPKGRDHACHGRWHCRSSNANPRPVLPILEMLRADPSE